MSAMATLGSRFNSETSRSVMRSVIALRATPSASACSMAKRASSAAEPRRRAGFWGWEETISGVRKEAVLAAHPHLTGAAGVLQSPGALVGGGLGLFLLGSVVGVDALVFNRPATFVAGHGKGLAIGCATYGHGCDPSKRGALAAA